MSEAFKEALAAYVSNGNTYEGYPTRVAGKVVIKAPLGGCHIKFGEGCRLFSPHFEFTKNRAQLILGERSTFRGKVIIGGGSSISIGDGTAVNYPVLLEAVENCSITIGKGCLISQIEMRTSDMHSVIDVRTGLRVNPSRNIKIHDRVWIAKNVTIQKGVTIGADSIVAAHSLVTKSFAPGTLIGGVPARALRRNVKWSRELMPMPSLDAIPYAKRKQTLLMRVLSVIKALSRPFFSKG